MATRNSTTSSSSGRDPEYFLFIQGLSPQCRWQEVKDVIRSIPPEGHVRQAYMDNDNDTVWGHITVLNIMKALNVYDFLHSNGWKGHTIQLTLVVKDETDPSSLRRLRGPEYSLVYPSQSSHPTTPFYSSQNSAVASSPVSPILIGGCCDYERSATYSRFEASSIAPTSQPTLQIVAQPLLLLQHPATHYYDSHLPSAMPGYQNLNSQFPPSSHANSHHHYKSPVNKTTRSSSALGSLSSSSIDNEGRTVHVYNLSYTVSQQAIKEYFASAGVVDRFLFKKCPSKYKAVAAITFRTPQQAQTAIQQFDRNIWNGYKLRVRLNRGPDASVVRNITSSMTPGKRAGRELRDGPVVVNGSGPSMSNRRGSVCSDDESSS